MRNFRLLNSVALVALLASPANATMQDIPSQGFQWPAYPVSMGTIQNGNTLTTGTNLNGATLKLSFCGRIYQNDLTFRNGSATKDIQSIGWTAGNKSGTWTLQVSSQGISTAAGPPIQPDGTIKGAGNAAFAATLSTAATANAFNTTANFGANDTGVHYGDGRCFVFEFSAYTSGAIAVSGALGTDPMPFGAALTTYNGAAWSAGSAGAGSTFIPTIQINFSDATSGSLAMTMPLAYVSSTAETLNSGTSPREIGMEFQTPFNAQISGLCVAFNVANASSNSTLELTDKIATPNVLATINLLGSQARASGAFQGMTCYPTLVGGSPTRVSITRNTSYVLGLFGTTASANNVQLFTNAIPAAASLDNLFGCGRKCGRVTRSAGGTWSAISNTQLPVMAVVIQAVDDNTGP